MQKLTLFYDDISYVLFVTFLNIDGSVWFLANMNGEEFYGPALPPGFTKQTSSTQSPEDTSVPSTCRKRRHHSTSSDASSSSASSHSSEERNGDRHKAAKKELSKLSEEMFGPALPIALLTASQPIAKESSFIGPVLPAAAVTSAPKQMDDDNDDIGPSPALSTESTTQSTIEQIESRAKLMKDKLEGKVFCYYCALCCTSIILLFDALLMLAT